MDKSTYTTGTWLGIVRQGAVVALEAGTDPAIVNHLWDCLGGQPTIHGILNELTEQFGTGLAGLPSFAILLRGDRLHAILRGDIDLVAHTEAGAELVSGRDVATWSERSLPCSGAVELVCADDSAGSVAGNSVQASGLVLPVGEAVVRMQSLRLGIQDSDSAVHKFFAKTPIEVVQQFETETAAAEGTEAAEGDEASDDFASESDFAPGNDFAPENGYAPENDYALDTDFALAADAEWNAQLAPVTGAPVENELGLTIRPDESDEFGEYHHDAADADVSDDSAPAAADAEPGMAEGDQQSGPNGPETEGPETGNQETGVDQGEESEPDQNQDSDQSQNQDSDQSQNQKENQGRVEGRDQGLDLAPDAATDSDDGFTTNYDFLFGATVAQSVDNAAVRLGKDGVPLSEDGGPVVPPLPMQPPAVGKSAQESDLDREGGQALGAESDGGPSQVPATGPATGQDAEQESAGSGAMLIDSVPWAKPVQQIPITHAPAAQAAQSVAGAPAVQTSVREQTSASGLASAGGQASAGDGPYDPDHDGHTVLRGQFTNAAVAGGESASSSGGGPASASGGEQGASQADSAPGSTSEAQMLASRPPTGPMVLARVCPNGHANPPSLPICGRCNAAELSEPREVGRPRLGRMHISNGEVIDLDHSLIIGRQPSVSRVLGEAMPRLVQVKSGNGDISRSHVEVRPDGWDVLLVDLKATNGTVLVREGQAPRRLSQGEEAILINGDIAELGDGVSLLFDGLL